jgi:hypothetical protein
MNSNASVKVDGSGVNRPEWLRLPDVTRLFGISRSHCYTLIAEGSIESISLKKRGALRGVRIVKYDSISSYFASLAASA